MGGGRELHLFAHFPIFMRLSGALHTPPPPPLHIIRERFALHPGTVFGTGIHGKRSRTLCTSERSPESKAFAEIHELLQTFHSAVTVFGGR